MQSNSSDLLRSIVAPTNRVHCADDTARRDGAREPLEAGGPETGSWSPLWHRDVAGQPVPCACLPLALRCIGYPVETSDGVTIGAVSAVVGPRLTVAAPGGALQLDVSAIRSTAGGRIQLHLNAASIQSGSMPTVTQ
jgi:hypothetical protein